MTITVTSAVLDRLLAEAAAAFPREACGLLFGGPAMIDRCEPATNIHPEPRAGFEIDPQALINAYREMRHGGPKLVGCYHSHPHGRLEPSATDLALAARDGMIWAIVGVQQVTFWRADSDAMSPLPILMADA